MTDNVVQNELQHCCVIHCFKRSTPFTDERTPQVLLTQVLKTSSCLVYHDS